MTDIVRNRRTWTGFVALAAATAAADAFLSSAPVAGAVAILAAAIAIAVTLTPAKRQPDGNAALVEKVTGQAASGRRLVIYERETGLFAYWYIVMRGEEECERARRYAEPFTLAIVEPSPGGVPQMAIAAVTDWINRHIRAADSAAYAGHGRHVLLMPRTNEDEAAVVLRRLAESVPDTHAATSTFGSDGATFEDLYAAAVGRLPEVESAAAA